MTSMLDAALAAARAGAEVISAAWSSTRDPSSRLKGAGDYVTEVDLASEHAVKQLLTEATPDIPIVAEEGGGSAADRYWLVDPLDGTTNFMHGFRQ